MLHTARRWPGTLRADGRAPTDCSTGCRVPARPCWQGAGAVREAGNRHQSWHCGGSCQFLSCLLPKVCNSPSKSLLDPVVPGFLLEITSAALSCCGSVCFGFSTHRGNAHYSRQILWKGYRFINVVIICAFELVRKNPVHPTFGVYMNIWIALLLHISSESLCNLFLKTEVNDRSNYSSGIVKGQELRKQMNVLEHQPQPASVLRCAYVFQISWP